MNALPQHCRAAVLLCYREGRTRGSSRAAGLSWSLRTLERRAGARTGGYPPASKVDGAAALTLSADHAGHRLRRQRAPGQRWRVARGQTMATAANQFAAGKPAAGGLVSAQAIALAKMVLGGMALTKVTILAAIVLIGARLAAVGGMAYQAGNVQKVELAKPSPLPLAIAKQPKTIENRVDRFGDALPAGVLARVGTVRFRHAETSLRPLSCLTAKASSREVTTPAWCNGTSPRESRCATLQASADPCAQLALSSDGTRLAPCRASGEGRSGADRSLGCGHGQGTSVL